MLRFGGYLLRFHFASDWSWNNKHSRHFLWRSRFYGKDCNSPVALIFTPIASMLLYGWIVSTTGRNTHNINSPLNILSCNRCYGLRPLLTALRCNLNKYCTISLILLTHWAQYHTCRGSFTSLSITRGSWHLYQGKIK